jgi:surfactin synthase thioesterase subunit
MRDARELAEGIASELDLNGTFVLLGHSAGSLIAYELACELQRRALPQPAKLIVCGHRGPGVPFSGKPTHRLCDNELKAMLIDLGATPASVPACDEMWELLVPSIRADLALSECYPVRRYAALEVPVTVFGGIEDRAVSRSDLEGWRGTTTDTCTVRLLPGGHFFVREPLFLSTLADELGTVLTRPTEVCDARRDQAGVGGG